MNEPHSHPKWLTWLLPSIGVAIWLIFFAGLALSNWREVMISGDGDPSLHWRIGNWIIENRAMIFTEQFSHTRLGAPLISKEWLSEVIFAAAGNAFGWNGATVLAALLIATTLGLLYRRIRADGVELLVAVGIVLAAAAGCTTHWLARPHLITHLLTVVFVWQLDRFERGQLPAWKLFALFPPLMLLWTNLHGAFFTGFVLLGIYWIAALWERHWTRVLHLTGLGLLCLLASFVNPNGWNLHRQIFEFLGAPILSAFTNEFRSPNFHTSGARGLLVMFLLLGLLLMVARPKLRRSELLLLAVWGYFALHSIRNAPIFALVAAPILAVHFHAWLQRLPAHYALTTYRGVSARVTGLDAAADGRLLALAGTVYICWLTLLPAAFGRTPVVQTEVLTNRFPAAAVQWLKQNHATLPCEMFNDYGWGGYLMLYFPERKVFVDGRNDFYGPELIIEFNKADNVEPGWEDVFAKYNVGWTILPTNHPLNSLLLLKSNDWPEAYRDDVAIIRARRQPAR